MFTMRAGYTEADFARAVEVVGRGGSLASIVEGLGIDWDYLTWLAIGVAEGADVAPRVVLEPA